MVEEFSGQYTAAGRSHSGFFIQLEILYCLGKQLISKQASRRDFKANKQVSKQRASKLGNQASRGVFCLLACLSASLVRIDDLGLQTVVDGGKEPRFRSIDSF